MGYGKKKGATSIMLLNVQVLFDFSFLHSSLYSIFLNESLMPLQKKYQNLPH